MSVKLQFAYNESRLCNISERLEANNIYYCPFCKDKVIAKKGEKRSQHFAHMPGSNCSANAETILHFEAKCYLHMMINNKKANDLILSYSANSIFPLVSYLSNELNINQTIDISLQQILNYYSCHNALLESNIAGSPYIADVYLPANRGLVIEVFVTHEMEDEKKAFLENNHFPYIEVIPFYNDNGKLGYTLHSSNLPGFFDTHKHKLDKAVKEYLYPLYEQELIKKAEKELENEEVLDYKIQAVKALLKDIQQDDSSKLYYSLLQRMDEQSTKTRVTSFMTEVKKEEPLRDIQYIKTKDKRKVLMGNDKNYFMSNEQNILFELVQTLLSQIEINALIGTKSGQSKELIVGFDLMIPQPSKLKEAVQQGVIDVLEGYIRRFEAEKTKQPLI